MTKKKARKKKKRGGAGGWGWRAGAGGNQATRKAGNDRKNFYSVLVLYTGYVQEKRNPPGTNVVWPGGMNLFCISFECGAIPEELAGVKVSPTKSIRGNGLSGLVVRGPLPRLDLFVATINSTDV